MVLTRLSHLGEVCPLGDHSYSGLLYSSSSSNTTNRRIISQVSKVDSVFPNVDDIDPSNYSRSSEFHLLDFPSEVLEKIFSYLSFKNVGELRLTCKRFDKVCSSVLNMAFQKLQAQMLNKYQAMKAQMPRRESARRKHPLARESDILETLHMRLSLLQMTFGKHIERKHCCFFAGEILDEVFRILRCIKTTQNLGKVFKITDELFDLTAMAMEYFKEHIEPSLPEISYFGSEFIEITKFSNGNSKSSSICGRISEQEDEELSERDSLPPSNMVLRKRIRKIRQGMKRYNSQLSVMTKQLKSCRSKITSQYKQIMEYVSRMEEYDKKVDETSRKLSTVLQELNKCKTEIQYWRSKSPAHHHVMFCACGRTVGSEIIGGNGEAMSLRENEDERSNLTASSSFHSQPVLVAASSSMTAIKNLEPFFDFNLHSLSKNAQQLPTDFSSSPINYSLKKYRFGSGSEKRLSSDEDTDPEIDTVGRRVKERKRIRIEPH